MAFEAPFAPEGYTFISAPRELSAPCLGEIYGNDGKCTDRTVRFFWVTLLYGAYRSCMGITIIWALIFMFTIVHLYDFFVSLATTFETVLNYVSVSVTQYT
jgi:hypothetical protein